MDGTSITNANRSNHYRLQLDADCHQFCNGFSGKLNFWIHKWTICVIAFLFFVQIICYVFIFKTNFSFRCEPCNYATDFNGMFIAYLTYSYFILKLIDYFDTVFFILRKKWTQVSFLHVYHHLLVSVGAYIWVLFVPGSKKWHYHSLLLWEFDFLYIPVCLYGGEFFLAGSQGVLFAFLNCFVHAVMYTYYLISICKPKSFKPSIRMKKNITRLQMVGFFCSYFDSMKHLFLRSLILIRISFHFSKVQFCLLFIHLIHVVVIPGCDCGYPKILPFLASTQCLFMFVLFENFYRRAYGSKMEHQKIQWSWSELRFN